MAICIGNKPCKYMRCIHYIEDCTNEEYKKMKYCGVCARAFSNKTDYLSMLKPVHKSEIKDYFITDDEITEKREDLINLIGSSLGYLFIFIVLFLISIVIICLI